MTTLRKPYPSDVSDEEWPFVVAYLTLMRHDAPQREYGLRNVFDALRWMVCTGAGACCRMISHHGRPYAEHGFVLVPRRWVVERDFAWMSRFRRLARDYEQLPETLAGLHRIAFLILMLQRLSALNSS